MMFCREVPALYAERITEIPLTQSCKTASGGLFVERQGVQLVFLVYSCMQSPTFC